MLDSLPVAKPDPGFRAGESAGHPEAAGSQEKLEWLEKRNLFMVPLDDERRWYSNVARYQGEFKAARAYAELALSLIPGNLPPQDNAQMRAVFSMPLATAYDGLGDLERAVSAYAETVR